MSLAIKCVLAVMVWLLPALAAAGTYWVSPTGAAANYAACASSTPLSGTAACTTQQAFDNAVAGDTIYFRGGTYTVPQKNFGDSSSTYYIPANSGTEGNWITFQAYPGEVPVFNGTSGGTGDSWGTNGYIGCKLIGTLNVSYIILDGFSLQCDSGAKMAGMVIRGNPGTTPGPYLSNHIIVQNCTLNGGTDIHTGSDNADGLRLDGSDDVIVRNNTFYNYRETANYANTTATKSYHTSHVVFDGNHIYDSTTAIYDKSGGLRNTYRYNFIHDTHYGIHIPSDSWLHRYGHAHDNIMYNVGWQSFDVSVGTSSSPYVSTHWVIHNNTIYSASSASMPVNLNGPAAPDRLTFYSFYNNIIAQAGTDYGGTNVRTGLDATEGLVINGLGLDYNNYGANMGVRLVAGGVGTTYTTIAGLQAVAAYNLASGLHNQHSIKSAPTFTNGTGAYSAPADFVLTAASAGYQAGSDGKDMGANAFYVGLLSMSRKNAPVARVIPVTSTVVRN